MTKPLIVILGDDSDRDLKLIKEIGESHLNETFGTLLDYILNPNADPLNSEYNSDEKALAKTWRDIYNINRKAEDYLENLRNEKGKDYQINLRDLASKKEISIGDQISLYAIDKNNNLIECPQDKIVNDYSDRIIKVTELPEHNLNYKHIDIIIERCCMG